MSCPICIENYSEIYLKIICEKCNYESCRLCSTKYILEHFQEPRCMNCQTIWSHSFLIKNFSTSFLSKLKKRLKKILFEKEKARFPETLPEVEIEKKIINAREEVEKLRIIIPKVDITLANYRYQIACLRNKIRLEKRDSSERSQLKKKKKELSTNMELIKYQQSDNKRYLKNILKYMKDGREIERACQKFINSPENRTFLKQCPSENCRGFLDNFWKCGLCQIQICSKCHETKSEQHYCLPDNIESARLIENDSKSCPKCGIAIFKISGCDQMFCTVCHTPFSWSRGTIDTGNIHNPHYFEWRRQQPEQHVKENCENPLTGVYIFDDFMGYTVNRDANIYVVMFSQNFVHYYEMMRENSIFSLRDEDNLDLRVKYLLNKIDQKKMMNILYSRKKEREMNIEYRQVFEIFLDVAGDLCRKYSLMRSQCPEYYIYEDNWNSLTKDIKSRASTPKNRQKYEEILHEMSELCKYVIEHLQKIGDNYHNTSYQELVRDLLKFSEYQIYYSENVDEKHPLYKFIV